MAYVTRMNDVRKHHKTCGPFGAHTAPTPPACVTEPPFCSGRVDGQRCFDGGSRGRRARFRGLLVRVAGVAAAASATRLHAACAHVVPCAPLFLLLRVVDSGRAHRNNSGRCCGCGLPGVEAVYILRGPGVATASAVLLHPRMRASFSGRRARCYV